MTKLMTSSRNLKKRRPSPSLNARIGKPCESNESNIIGRYGYQERDVAEETPEVRENRDMLIQCCKVNDSVLTSTSLKRTPNKLITFRKTATKEGTPIEERGYAQLDSIMVRRRFKNSIIDAESDMKAKIRTDHYPVKCKMQCKFKTAKRRPATAPSRYSARHMDKISLKEMNQFFSKQQSHKEVHTGMTSVWRLIRVISKRNPPANLRKNNGTSARPH